MGSTQNWEAAHQPDALRRVNQARANAYAESMSKQDIKKRREEGMNMYYIWLAKRPMYFRGVRLQWDEEIG